MTTVQMTLEPDLVAEIDRVSRKEELTRSAFTRRALREALDRVRVRELEHRQREGYRRKPVRRGEFTAWTREQAWPESCDAATSGGTGLHSRTRGGQCLRAR